MSSGGQAIPSDFALRFRSSADWFTHSESDGLYTSVIGANSERAVDLLQTLAWQFPEMLSVSISSLRERKSWWDNGCSRSDTRDVIARLKLLLAGYGGVEFAIYTNDDQLTLTPELELIVYSRSPRWRDVLVKLGLEERSSAPTAVWCASRGTLSVAPELLDSLSAAVKRLGLAPGDFDVEPSE
ncbi:MAG: hypothetical protein ABI120_18145 [Gemmatimonadaceae bacterium]